MKGNSTTKVSRASTAKLVENLLQEAITNLKLAIVTNQRLLGKLAEDSDISLCTEKRTIGI